MPTIDRIGPYRFFFYANEQYEPPHVHVQRDSSLAKFWLDPVFLASSAGFRPHELRQIHAIVEPNRQRYLDAWNAFFSA